MEREPMGDSSLYEWLIAQMYKALVNPAKDTFLPKLIVAAKNPTLEPFIPPAFPQPPAAPMLEGATVICSLTAPRKKDALPSANPDLKLSDVVFTGTSNLKPRVPVVQGQDVTLVADFSTIAGYPPHLAINGRFDLRQQCCVVDFGVPQCQPNSEKYVTTGSGTFSARIVRSTLTGMGRIDIVNKEPVVTVSKFAFSADPTDVRVEVDIKTIPDPKQREQWNKYAAQAFNAPSTINAMLKGLNDVFAQPESLAAAGKKLTEIVKAIFGERALDEH